MIQALKRWFGDRPYTTTGLIVLAALMFGWGLLGWGERQFGFVLLVYFIITLGVRLDEISRILGGGGGNPRGESAEEETIASQLREIASILNDIRSSLAGRSSPPAPENDKDPES
jgi:hypothetical protein